MPRKKREKKPTQASTFKLKDVDKEFEKLVGKFRDKAYPKGEITTAKTVDIPVAGFYLVMLLREGDSMTTKSFGRDMPAEMVADGLLRAIYSVTEALKRQNDIPKA